MSDTSILPGAGATTESDVDMVPPGTGFDDIEGSGDRRRFLIIGAVAGAVVLLVAAYLLLRGGGSSPSQPFVPSNAGTAPSAPPSAATGGTGNGNGHDGTGTTLPKKAKHNSVRDPFTPLVLPPVTTDSGPTSTTTVKAKQPALPTAPPAPVVSAPVQTAPPSPAPTNPSQSNNSGPQWIELKRIHGRVAVFDVGYPHDKFRRFAVEAPKPGSQSGTVFDKIFSLIGIQNHQVTIQIGDDTPFDLSKGVSHTV